ncbi:MAG: sterol desaturase family protein [Congregibacter sp.]
MTEILQQNESWIYFWAIVGTFSACTIAEMIAPRRNVTADLAFRWVNNIGLAVVTTFIVKAVLTAAGVVTTWWAEKEQIGLLQWLAPAWWISCLLVLLLLGLADYLYHRLLHAVPFLWRFHAVHHSDTDFDVTTTYRNHPLAAIILLGFRLPVIAALGAPVSALIFYELIRVTQDLWSHSNIKLPERVDKYLRYIAVTPDFHRIHHCSDRQYTDSNFSSTVPWFDYLFGTYRNRPYDTHPTMEIGIERFRELEESRLDQLLLMPLRVSNVTTGPDVDATKSGPLTGSPGQ